MPTDIDRSIGTKATVSADTISIDATGLIITRDAGTWPTDSGIGDELIIDVDGTPETVYIASRDSSTQLTLQAASSKTSESGHDYTLDRYVANIAAFPGAIVADGLDDLVTDDTTVRGLLRVDGLDASRPAFLTDLLTSWDKTHNIHYLPATDSDRGDGTLGGGYHMDSVTSGSYSTWFNGNTFYIWEDLTVEASDGGGIFQLGGTPFLQCKKVCFGVTSFGDQVLTVGTANGSASDPILFESCFWMGDDDNGMSLHVDTVTNHIDVLNCVIANNKNGIDLASTYTTGVFNIKNTYVHSKSGTDYVDNSSATVNITTCYSDDGTLGTTVAFATGSGAKFANITAGSEDYHITTGSALLANATVLSPVFTDIDYKVKPTSGNWDGGYHEFTVAGGAKGPLVNSQSRLKTLVGGSLA